MKSSFPKRYKSILIVFMKITFFYLDRYILLIFNFPHQYQSLRSLLTKMASSCSFMTESMLMMIHRLCYTYIYIYILVVGRYRR